MKKTQRILLLLIAMALVSCKKPISYGNLSVNIDYSINGNSLITDSLYYHNEAENEFMITEIQWFISKMELQNEQGDWYRLNHKKVELPFAHPTDWIFYIDTNIPETQILEIASLPVGKYKTLRFNFGLDEDDNQTGLFNNPPESNMFWPDPLGGGYHYMKLNGRFVDSEGQLVPLNIHLGIGQNEDHSIFYQNYFTIEGPINLTITEDTENQFDLCMIIDNWFRSPNLYDFNEFGSAIMQNQAAQQVLKENGQDVFTWSVFEKQNDKDMKKEVIVEGFNRFMQKAAPKPHFWTWKNVKQTLEQIKESSKNRS